MKKFILLSFLLLTGIWAYSQTSVSGKILDSEGNGLSEVNISVFGTSVGASTDSNGEFRLQTNQSPPFSLRIQHVGYQTQTVSITETNQTIKITLLKADEQLDEIVISASRTPERIRESPVTIERIGIREVNNTSSPNFYDGLENLKGVQSNSNSLTFKAVNTRGFATFGNSRFIQLLDGQDVASPALNFPLGNIIGVSDLDVSSVELIPGAASALYGANAFNGILSIHTKSPFDYQGLSLYIKPGITVQEIAGTNSYTDVGARYAKAFNDKFAFKLNFSYIKGEDWHAGNTNHQNPDQTITSDIDSSSPFYDGVNVYGDEVSASIDVNPLIRNALIQQGFSAAAIPDNVLPGRINPTRTGYLESSLVDYKATNLKADVGLYYKLTEDLQLSWTSRIGQGNSVYQGLNRYALRDFLVHLHKIELEGKHFFWRAYASFENAGDSYDTRFTAININEIAKPSSVTDENGTILGGWFPDYTRGFVTSYALGLAAAISGGQPPDVATLTNSAHNAGRDLANRPSIINGVSYPGTLSPDTEEFIQAFDQITYDGNLTTGSKFIDASEMFHTEGNYNFKDVIDFAEILVGGSYRKFRLNSEGTIFTDSDGPIDVDEYAAYMQITKRLFDERLKLTGSIRYDKSQNFDASFSPRVSAVLSLGENKEHNIRASFQTGFRNPDTQSQYIGLNVGNAFLVGTTKENLKRFSATVRGHDSQPYSFTGEEAFNNSYTYNSVLAFQRSKNPNDLEVFDHDLVKQENIKTYEIGYRGAVTDLDIDFNVFFSEYNNFSVNRLAAHPNTGQVGELSVIGLSNTSMSIVQFYGNAEGTVTSAGIGLGLNYKIGKYYQLGGNWTWQNFKIEDKDSDLEARFNTPKHIVKTSFGTRKFINDRWGFSLDYRWSDSYFWESSFADGPIDSKTIVDAQVSYKAPQWKATIKLGGSNIFQNEYTIAPGAGNVGSIYYLSWTYNN